MVAGTYIVSFPELIGAPSSILTEAVMLSPGPRVLATLLEKDEPVFL